MGADVIAFVRPDGAGGLGHVGWGFMLPNRTWLIGSMENPSGWPVTLPGWTGFWYCKVGDPMRGMRDPAGHGAPQGSPPYAHAKVLHVPQPRLQAAQEQLRSWANRPYTGVGGNCLNCTYDVLEAFGAALPNPTNLNAELWTPNGWFKALSGNAIPVR